MQSYFYELIEALQRRLRGDEVFVAWFDGEDSDFVRYNRGRVRQPGTVMQRALQVDLISGARHATCDIALSGQADLDQARLFAEIERVREVIPHLPEDPHLLYSETPVSTERIDTGAVPEATDIAVTIAELAGAYDFVGLYAGGLVYKGFASSLGQRNWFQRPSFHLDFSLYHGGDKAVKAAYAGFAWDTSAFSRKLAEAAEQLAVLGKPAKTIAPGKYRVYLAPAAMSSLLWLLAWDGFGLKCQRTKQSALIKMALGEAQLSPLVSMRENTRDGAGPGFQSAGFVKPDSVSLIREGRLVDALISPRSAKEYGAATNGANSDESPLALDMAPGDLEQGDILSRLSRGIYINNLWYLNYSDQSACRITGMTRFATFWVEDGVVQAPLNVMRFDETLYRMLGDNLEALTRERDLLLDSDTYYRRSVGSMHVPGALIRDMTFTL